MADQKDAQFHTTQWTLLMRPSTGHSTQASSALTLLCESYRQPVYRFILRTTGKQTEAEDLTQSFFTTLIEKKSYRQADPSRGKFRTFLLASVKNFLNKDYRDRTRLKRGGTAQHSSIDSAAFIESHPLEFDESLDLRFDHNWAITVFDFVWDLLQKEYQQTQQEHRFSILKDTLMLPERAVPYTELAQQLDLTVNGVKSATFRMRKRFRELFRTTVAQLVDHPTEVDAEISHLMQALLHESENS